MTDHLFKPGRPGGPGRPKGLKNKRTLVGEALEAQSEDVAKAVVAAAIAGDMQAAKLVLDRVKPPLRNEGPRVQFEYDRSLPLVEQAQQVFKAIALGQCDVDTGKVLIDCLCSFAKLRETDELVVRINALEQQALAAATTGHVLGRVMQTTEAS